MLQRREPALASVAAALLLGSLLPGCATGDDDDSAAGDSAVVLNELLASNDSVLADEGGEFDDWLELYNSGTEALDLGGWMLSGGPRSAQEPWTLADGVSVPPLGFLVIWADDDPEQGDLHTDFKLSKAGETLVLYRPSGEPADEVSFPAQDTDLSWGRLPDGTGDWQQLGSPSPQQSNE